MECLAPVEYAVAVDLYLDQSPLSRASRRVYQISLAGWAWPLVGRPVPPGRQRRGAAAPLVPLALLNDPGTARRLSAAFAERTTAAGPRTANRELSALRSATGWIWTGTRRGPGLPPSRGARRPASCCAGCWPGAPGGRPSSPARGHQSGTTRPTSAG